MMLLLWRYWKVCFEINANFIETFDCFDNKRLKDCGNKRISKHLHNCILFVHILLQLLFEFIIQKSLQIISKFNTNRWNLSRFSCTCCLPIGLIPSSVRRYRCYRWSPLLWSTIHATVCSKVIASLSNSTNETIREYFLSKSMSKLRKCFIDWFCITQLRYWFLHADFLQPLIRFYALIFIHATHRSAAVTGFGCCY